MFFVAGITGHVGGAAARTLLDAGHEVRALVRDPAKASAWAERGVDVRRGDLNDAAALAGALEGVEGAYLMLPPFVGGKPDFAETRAMLASFREALGAAPPPRLVALSSIGSEKSSGLGLITQTHLLEEALDDLPFPVAFVRAGSFIENYVPALAFAEASGAFDSYWTPTDRAIPMVGSEDIGREVARLLAGEWSGRRVVELGTRTSPDDVARAMSEVFGRTVVARPVPREELASALERIGMPPGSTGPFEEMVAGVNSGWIDFGVPGTEPVAATLTPAEVFRRARTA